MEVKNRMSNYEKKRTQIRLNALVASLLLFVSAFLAILYGSAQFATMWVIGNQTMAIAVMGISFFVAVLCILFWLKIIMKLRAKLAQVEKDAPMMAVTA